ncbi:TraB/GumN family protein [Candidatus Stoquefichus sp. SB1]|uniref:TraB/GumN family protein n=1 Tax=Candidatus Stoquefichus sp. SB1 TaxID=1658109 RepID=UPI0018E3955A|nr:TraB/GumN family protein [Candidatus Stoquefichus sp. SB1]
MNSVLMIILSFVVVMNLTGCSLGNEKGEVIDVSVFLYKIVNSKGNYSYLLGTCHPGRNEIKTLDKVTEDSLNESENIWLEVTLDQSQYNSYAHYLSDNSIDDMKLTEELDKVKEEYFSLKRYSNIETLNAMALSSYALNDILKDINGNEMNSIDLYIFDYANKKNNFKEIESLEKQFSLFSDISLQCSNYIMESLLDREGYIRDSKEFLDAYYSGNRQYFKRNNKLPVTEFKKEAELYQKMLGEDRNIFMTNEIKSSIEEECIHFFGIGCRHLYGENGIIELLKQDGYDVISMSSQGGE